MLVLRRAALSRPAEDGASRGLQPEPVTSWASLGLKGSGGLEGDKGGAGMRWTLSDVVRRWDLAASP